MTHLPTRLLVLVVICVAISENSARFTSVIDEGNLKTYATTTTTTTTTGNGESIENKDEYTLTTTKTAEEQNTTTTERGGIGYEESENENKEQEKVYLHSTESSAIETAEEAYSEEPDGIQTKQHEQKHDIDVSLHTMNGHTVATNDKQITSMTSISNKTNLNPEPMTSEVQVDDFMKSRVAYHDAIVADVGLSETDHINPSKDFNSFYDKPNLESVEVPEKITIEETADMWKESTGERDDILKVLEDNEVLTTNSTNVIDVDIPEVNKHTIADVYQREEYNDLLKEQERSNYSNYNNLEQLPTTQTSIMSQPSTISPVTYHTFSSLNESQSSNNTIAQPNVSKEHTSQDIGLGFATEKEFEPKYETKLTNPSNSSQNEFNANNPTAERFFAFEMEKHSKGNISDYRPYRDLDTDRKPTSSQSFRDFKDISEEDVIETQNLLPDHPSFKKEKIEPGLLFEECVDCDFRILPIRPSEQRDAPKMEEESLSTPTIRFPDLPEGRELQIYSLELSEGSFLFGYLGEFLSWIQPNDFPVELLRDALRSQITWVSLITQSLEVEVGFVALLVVGVLLALAVPVVVLSHACYRITSSQDDDADDKVGWAGNCRRRTLVFILQILLVLLLGGMVAMFVTNEQLSEAVVKSSDVVQTSLSDVSTFVHNSHLQLHFLVTQSMDQVLQAIYADLDNVDTLLGRPIQQEMVRETGIDVALESLADLTREAKETTQQVERLLDEVRVVQEMVISTSEKMSDLRQQVELFRRACGPRDRALCDTIDATGLDVTLRVDRLKNDNRLHRMRRMGGIGLETASAEAKARFTSVPSRVVTDTRDAREAARRQLIRQRADVDDRSVALERLVRDMTEKVSEAKYQSGFWMQDINQFEYWRWIICMGGGAAVLMVWTMLLCSLCCGCCGSEKAAGPTILMTIVLVCLLSTALWSVALVGMLFGGHGEVFVCRPLYDEPDYHVITRLVDQPGVFYSQPKGGFIANVIYGNDTLDVPIRHVLEECRENHALYPTLGLGRVFDVEAAVDQNRWSSVSMQLRSVRANLSSLEVLSPVLQDQLGDLLTTLSVNFTEHRIQMSRPVTGKDMDSFARQLDNIGNQMRDLAVASRMETLSTRTRRLIDSHIRPLESKKDALVYQLTALEVQTGPLQRQVNQSLSHLKTIQFFINSQGEAIAQRKSRQYVDRLLNYVDQLRRHVTDSVSSNVATCRPLWDIFNTTRLFLCRHTMDPLNGFWFASMWCLIVLLVATPVCLKLVDYYRAQGCRSSGSPSENLVISEQGAAWSSPGTNATGTATASNDNW
ncbi:prominin-1-A isoform X2 [Macrosteles quadrilineatus]|uniref:prominin-1-A isoform X2 n=1 Tax=Macrosteles quadrilineatus TaxID=74068 RepID=UPI0023E2AAFF|nr:prominin-1-A isoform X2 [Macrosteles quadrilineatus]